MESISQVMQPLPLAELTNSTSEWTDRDAFQRDDDKNPPHKQRLRRSGSSYSLAQKFDSLETLSLDQDSIYNADRILSSHSLASLDNPTAFYPGVSLRSTVKSTVLHSLYHPDLELPHSGWPPTYLEPIIERRSRSSMKDVSSIPRFRRSPQRQSTIINPRCSIHSLRPKPSGPSLDPPSGFSFSQHWRSFSLNDIDCLLKSDTNQARLGKRGYSLSSSSTEILETIGTCPVFPLRPSQPPPYRTPTPPGLPSFGTKEAQEYRLIPAQPPSRTKAFVSRWFKRSNRDGVDQNSATNNLTSPISLLPSSSSVPQVDLPRYMLRQVLGMSRVVVPVTPSNKPSRIRLPPGIHIETVPGPLIQAEDGTMVRGRWGHRSSAHGVGNRGLGNHPFTRTTEVNSIDAIVREIDKACEVVYRNDLPRPPSHVRSADNRAVGQATPGTHQGGVDTTVAAESTDTDIDQCGIDIVGATSGPHENQNTGPKPQSNHGQQEVLPQEGLVMMQEPSPYHIPAQPQCPPRDSLAAFTDYVSQTERDNMRQRNEKEKTRREDKCQDCWETFWLACCGLKR